MDKRTSDQEELTTTTKNEIYETKYTLDVRSIQKTNQTQFSKTVTEKRDRKVTRISLLMFVRACLIHTV